MEVGTQSPTVAHMPDDLSVYVDAVRRHYDDGCFACGRENPLGLHLDDFGLDDGEVSARFTPREHYRGAAETLHGGIAATAIDEILVWAGIIIERVLTVTGTMELRYRKPVGVNEEILVAARVEDRSGRRLQMSGELKIGDDVKVTGTGLYLVSADIDDLLSGDAQH